MARKPRIHIPGGVYHTIIRGNGGQDIFFNEADRNHLYLLLQEGISRFGYRVHAFCFMTNHIHLAIQVSDIPLSQIMQNLSFRYTRWINYQQTRYGHLFQGRYKAILADMDNYLLELIRYIHLNPIRAGMVDTPEKYSWNSHNAYIGTEVLPWLTTDWVLSQFSEKVSTARKKYQDFIHDGLGNEYGKEFYGNKKDSRFLGNDDFIENTLAKIKKKPFHPPMLNEIVARLCQKYNLPESKLTAKTQDRRASECRAVIGWLAIELQCATLTEVAKRFNRDVSTMSSIIRRFIKKTNKSEVLNEKLKTSLNIWKTNK